MYVFIHPNAHHYSIHILVTGCPFLNTIPYYQLKDQITARGNPQKLSKINCNYSNTT